MIAQFALRLICGMSLTWCVLPRGLIASGFFRVQMLVTMGLAVLAAMAVDESAYAGDGAAVSARIAGWTFWALAGVGFVGSVLWTLERRTAGTVSVYLSAAVSLGLLTSVCAPGRPAEQAGLLWVASDVSTALLLGSTMVAMLLGHWYLTAPTMSLVPLQWGNAVFAAAVAGRLAVSAVALAVGWGALTGGTPALWLTLRWGAGILMPLVLAVMVWRILRYRNTQSATGVLFVGVVVTFIGELSATLLARELGHPF